MGIRISESPLKRAIWTSLLWIGLALVFNYGIYVYLGKEAALNFLAGYLIEKSLSVDNLFIFLLLFKYFQTPPQLQHQALFWGVLGAIIMRGIFIFCGVALVQSFHWILYLLGIFLIYSGIKMGFSKKEISAPENNPLIKFLKKRMNLSPFFIMLITIELTDLIFAIDSIPAVMGITQDPFIIYTSNIFAILGLRSLYFVLAGVMPLFHYLHYGLAFILVFIGAKMLLEPFYTIPISIVLGVIVTTLCLSISFSRFKAPSK